jgi:hypothetical protein
MTCDVCDQREYHEQGNGESPVQARADQPRIDRVLAKIYSPGSITNGKMRDSQKKHYQVGNNLQRT